MLDKITSYEITKYGDVTVASLNGGFLYLIIDRSDNYKDYYYPQLENCFICKSVMGNYIVVEFKNGEQIFSQIAIDTKEEMMELVEKINQKINKILFQIRSY